MTSEGVKEVRRMVKLRLIPCEVFSRVCGYYRPIENFHAAKQEEFYARKMLDVEKAMEEPDVERTVTE